MDTDSEYESDCSIAGDENPSKYQAVRLAKPNHTNNLFHDVSVCALNLLPQVIAGPRTPEAAGASTQDLQMKSAGVYVYGRRVWG